MVQEHNAHSFTLLFPSSISTLADGVDFFSTLGTASVVFAVGLFLLFMAAVLPSTSAVTGSWFLLVTASSTQKRAHRLNRKLTTTRTTEANALTELRIQNKSRRQEHRLNRELATRQQETSLQEWVHRLGVDGELTTAGLDTSNGQRTHWQTANLTEDKDDKDKDNEKGSQRTRQSKRSTNGNWNNNNNNKKSQGDITCLGNHVCVCMERSIRQMHASRWQTQLQSMWSRAQQGNETPSQEQERERSKQANWTDRHDHIGSANEEMTVRRTQANVVGNSASMRNTRQRHLQLQRGSAA